MISVTEKDFNVQNEYEKLVDSNTGAVVIFAGIVRDFISPNMNNAFLLQHYPGMTENVLNKIVQTAHDKWELHNVRVIHRIGHLKAKDQIVFVGVSAQHRAQAFLACEFIIDTLKTQAPFWKKEGDKWVEANHKDALKSEQWINNA